VTPGVLSGIYGDAESEKPAPATDDDSKPPHTLN
jgi:hypothetical protein